MITLIVPARRTSLFRGWRQRQSHGGPRCSESREPASRISERKEMTTMRPKEMQPHHEPLPRGHVIRVNSAADEGANGSRRRFLQLNLVGLALAPAASLFVGTRAWAMRGRGEPDDTLAMLDPEDPQAKALSYTEDSPNMNQLCSNCQIYTGTEGEDHGPCAIFSYRVAPSGRQLLVKAAGWCRAWGPRQDI